MANSNQSRKLSVCATAQPTDLDKAGFELLTFVEVGNVGSMSDVGETTNILTYDTWSEDVIQKAKGQTNAGDPTIEVARDFADAGQVILRTAAATNLNYAFKIEANDSPDGILSNTIIYQRGLLAGPTIPQGRNEDFDLEIYQVGLQQKQVLAPPE